MVCTRRCACNLLNQSDWSYEPEALSNAETACRLSSLMMVNLEIERPGRSPAHTALTRHGRTPDTPLLSYKGNERIETAERLALSSSRPRLCLSTQRQVSRTGSFSAASCVPSSLSAMARHGGQSRPTPKAADGFGRVRTTPSMQSWMMKPSATRERYGAGSSPNPCRNWLRGITSSHRCLPVDAFRLISAVDSAIRQSHARPSPVLPLSGTGAYTLRDGRRPRFSIPWSGTPRWRAMAASTRQTMSSGMTFHHALPPAAS